MTEVFPGIKIDIQYWKSSLGLGLDPMTEEDKKRNAKMNKLAESIAAKFAQEICTTMSEAFNAGVANEKRRLTEDFEK